MRKQLTALILMIFLCAMHSSFAQVNTEKYRKHYTDGQGFLFNLKSTITIKAGNTEYTAYKGTGRLDHNGKSFDYFLVGSFEFKKTDQRNIENQGFAHLRGMWNFARRTNWEFFLQRQYDEFIDLNARNLAGTGLKYRIFESISPNDSSNTLEINISTGLMYEAESYDLETTTVDKYLWRSTNFVSFDWLIKEKLNLTGVVYYQPAFRDFQNFRIAAEAGFEFAVAKSLYFIFDMSYRFNNKPVTDVKKYDLTLENGIRFEIK